MRDTKVKTARLEAKLAPRALSESEWLSIAERLLDFPGTQFQFVSYQDDAEVKGVVIPLIKAGWKGLPAQDFLMADLFEGIAIEYAQESEATTGAPARALAGALSAHKIFAIAAGNPELTAYADRIRVKVGKKPFEENWRLMCLTRRYSQRPCLSRFLLRRKSRHPGSWLTFNVRKNRFMNLTQVFVSAASALIALVSLGLTIYTGWLTRRHYRRIFMPIINIDTDISPTCTRYSIQIHNCGPGVAIVKAWKLSIDGLEVKDLPRARSRKLTDQLGHPLLIEFTHYFKGDALQSGQRMEIIGIPAKDRTEEECDAFRASLKKISIEFEYESIYGQNWSRKYDGSSEN